MESATNPTSDSSTNCLKFGEKIYFAASSSSSKSPPPPPPPEVRPPGGRRKAAVTAQPPRCQVEGCHVDLSGSKAYYCRHKVCGMHSKAPKVVVSGISQRFCQQCSRFHELIEFDQGKRSCRRRLRGHNERRRKPPQLHFPSRFGAIHQDPTRYTEGYTNFPHPYPPPSIIRPVNPFQPPFVHTGSNPFILDPNLLYLPTTPDSICALSLLSTGSVIPSYNANEPLGFTDNLEMDNNNIINGPNLGRVPFDDANGLGMNWSL